MTEDIGRSADDTGASQATGLSSPTEPCSTVSALTGFDPSRFEYRFSLMRERRERHDWIISGKLGAINIWAEPSSPSSFSDERWFGGIECHSARPFEYNGGHHDHCWLLGAECWHDGSSLQFREQVEYRLPAPIGQAIDGSILEELKPLLRSRYRTWLAEPAVAESETPSTHNQGISNGQ